MDTSGHPPIVEALRDLVRHEVRQVLAELGPRDPDPCLSIADAAKHAGCSARTVRRWIARGDLVAHRVNRLVRVRRTDLERLLRAEVSGSPEALADEDFA